MIIFQCPTAVTEYLEDKKIVVLTQNGKNTGANLKESLNKGVEALIQHKAVKWLSDNRNMGTHTAEDVEWLNNDWTPRAIKAGWKKWALVQPLSALSAMSEKNLVDFFASNGIEVKIFETPEEGYKWLESV
ncbi:STAS/SEC14 domain-containing protein [Leptospira bandrabouensis]|uniref:STAS/SEC14 domain-containing protein n=1 Tax=Leptospira bandrabouensis TaxID=2484903 RepID=UPI001EEBC3A3|nr:STAS/SEC14 domain-containing protein [Leptospira bandrabouensis]MCG6146105.1 STAS/SEC14 domain-containing protein [Leptospira bandrabouensis]MCG6165692.1 STAS/SEC14 domain-containing protein [Leptospira bandrabouensis]